MGACGCEVRALCSGLMFQVVDYVMGKVATAEIKQRTKRTERTPAGMSSFQFVRVSCSFCCFLDRAKRCMHQAYFHRGRHRDGRRGRSRVLKSGSLRKRVGEALYGFIRPAPGIGCLGGVCGASMFRLSGAAGTMHIGDM